MKATGAEIKAFCDEWPPGPAWCLDDSAIEMYNEKGEFVIGLGKKYELDDIGTITWQGHEGAPEPVREDRFVSFELAFKKWKKARVSRFASVEIPNEAFDVFMAICRANGWKVTS